MAKLKFDDLFLAGSIITFHCGFWTAKLRITPKDLGVKDTEEIRKALSFGFHRLAPKEYFEKFQKFERDARNLVKENSVVFPIVDGARYVPEANQKIILDGLDAIHAEFIAERDATCKKYDELKAEMLPAIESALQKASKTKTAATAAYKRVEKLYPTASEVKSKFYMRRNVFAIRGAGVGDDETGQVKDIMQEMIGGLRQEVAKKVSKLVELSSNGGKLSQKSVDSALKVLDRVDQLNFMDDAVLTNSVKALRALLADVSDGTDEKAHQAMLKTLADTQTELESSVKDAMKQAESKLTSLGKRKLAV